MSKIPHGIPTISYCRVLPSTTAFGPADIASDGNAIIVHEPGQPSTRYDVAQLIDKTVSDEEACELTFGHRAGAGVGTALNPVTAFVHDAANVVVLLVGSKSTRKWQFLRRMLLPFLANEVVTTIAERSQDLSLGAAYKAQLTLSAFEIQDEIVCDLLRPGNRGLTIEPTLEEGVVVQGLHRETVVDEATLRRLLLDACDNRAVQTLPVGGSIDTSSGVFEFRLYQSDSGASASGNNNNGNNVHGLYQNRECYSRLIVVDVPSVDPLLASSSSSNSSLLAGPMLHKSLLTFVDVAKKLNNPYRAQIAPFRAARLPHYLSELLGGNAIVVAMAHVVPGEPATSKTTLELLAALNVAQHYPIGARELSDTLRGLLGKYRAMLIYAQDDLLRQSQTSSAQQQVEQDTQRQIEALQRELAQAVADKTVSVEERSRMFELAELLKAKYQTVLDEKLQQSQQLAEVEEDGIALAKTIVELNLEMATKEEQFAKEKFDWNVDVLQREARTAALEEEIKEHVLKAEQTADELQQKQALLAGNLKEIEELHGQLAERSQQLTEQKEKNIELGAELLTLVNHKDVLQAQHDEMKQEYDEMKAEHDNKQLKEQELETEIKQLLQKLLLKDEEVLELRKHLMDANDKTAQAQIETAANRRTADDMLVLKEELETKKMQQEDDRRRYASIADTLKDSVKTEQAHSRELQKELEELQRRLVESQQQCQQLQSDHDATKVTLQQESEQRQRLAEALLAKQQEEEELRLQAEEYQRERENERQEELLRERAREEERILEEERRQQERAERDRLLDEAHELSEQQKEEEREKQRLLDLQRDQEREEERKREEERIKATEEQRLKELEMSEQTGKQSKSNLLHKAVENMKLEAHAKKEREFQVKEEEWKRQISRLEDDLHLEEQHSQDLQHEVDSVQGKYRELLQSSLLLTKPPLLSQSAIPPDMVSLDADPTGNQESVDDAVATSATTMAVDQALKTLLQSFEDREIRLRSRNEQQTMLRREVLKAYRELYDRYRDSVGVMESSATKLLADVDNRRLLHSPSSENISEVELNLRNSVGKLLQEDYSFAQKRVSLCFLLCECHSLLLIID
jgi:hypothetical protein